MMSDLPDMTADEILACADLKPERIACPEWGCCVYVRGMTGEEFAQYDALSWREGKFVSENFAARTAAFGICDASGKLLFTPRQIEALGQKSIAPIKRCVERIKVLSGLSASEAEAIEKNSEATPGDTGS